MGVRKFRGNQKGHQYHRRGSRGVGVQEAFHTWRHGDEGGDDNEDAPLMNESIDLFDLDWVLERERMPQEVTVVEGVQVWGCGVAPIYPNLW